MKVFLIILIFQYCILYNNFLSRNLYIKNNTTQEIKNPERKIEPIINELLTYLGMLMFSNLQIIIDGFDNLDDECKNLWNIFEEPKIFINNIAQKSLRNGFTSNAIETEEECLHNNDVYILVKLEYSKSPIYQNYEKYSNQHILFIESFISDTEICLTNLCKDLYIYYHKEIIRKISKQINEIFELDNFEIVGFNYKINNTTNYDSTYIDENKGFKNRLKYFFWIIFIILIGCTIYCLHKENK